MSRRGTVCVLVRVKFLEGVSDVASLQHIFHRELTRPRYQAVSLLPPNLVFLSIPALPPPKHEPQTSFLLERTTA